MAYIDTIETVLERCRFLSSERELDRTNKYVRTALPPLSTIAVRGGPGARAFQAYPVVSSPRLVELLTHFLAEEVQGAEERGPRSAPFTQQDLEQFREEPYFSEMAALLVKTRAHGTVLRLDSIFWIHVAWLVAHLLHPTGEFERWVRELCPGVRDEALLTLQRLQGSSQAERQRAAELRRSALRSLITRNEYANRIVSRMVGDDRPNAMHTAMASNQLVFTLAPGFPTRFDLPALVAAKDYGLPASRLADLVRGLRAVIEDLYLHRDDQALSGTERFFYGQFFRTVVMEHARKLDPARLPGGAGRTFEDPEQSLTFKLGWTLVFHDDVLRYLLTHLDQLNIKRALPPKLRGQLSKEVLSIFDQPELLREREDRILELARDLRLLDLFDTLRDFQATLKGDQGSYSLDGKPLRSTAVALDLGSYYELYRRNRSGIAVFIDLIGFTRKTRDLFFGGGSSSTTEDVEVRDRGELAALALERVFHVRQELREFGGNAEGFEGDAILDLFADPLAALRYVARFAENYRDHARIQFRPFSRPVPNPFATEGFRVGIASGEYTLVNVPDMDAAGTLQMRLRAIGPAINKASRLNSGKKGGGELFLADGAEDSAEKVADPLEIFRVEVESHELANTGLCLDRGTFNELRTLVKRAHLPHWLPNGRASFEIEGRDAEPKAYRFHLIIYDPAGGIVFAIRRLAQVPKLKGLSENESVVYEALLFSDAEYLEFLRRDGELPASDWAVPSQGEDSVERAPVVFLSPEDPGDLSQSLPDYLYKHPSGGQEAVPELSSDTSHSTGSGELLFDGIDREDHVSLDDESTGGDLDVFASLELSDVWGGEEPPHAFSEDGESLASGEIEEQSAGQDHVPISGELLDRADAFFADLQGELSAELEDEGDGLDDYLDEFMARTGVEFSGEPSEPAISSGPGEPSEYDEDEDAVAFSIEEPVETSDELGGADSGEWAGAPSSEQGGDGQFLGSIDDSEDRSWDDPAEPAPQPQAAPTLPREPVSRGEGSTEVGVSLLGVVDDTVADRISEVLGQPYPHGGRRRTWTETERSVDVPSEAARGERQRVPVPELSMVFAEYNMVVRMLEHETEVWIGRLARSLLFDLHRYRLPTPPHGGVDLSGVLELFLRDKVREDFLSFGTRYAALPSDGSEPVALPLGEAERILGGLLGE